MQVAHPQSSSSSTWLLVKVEFGNVGFWGEGKAGVPGEKRLGARERTNNNINPHMASTPGFEPGPHWWEASALTTAPPLYLPSVTAKAWLSRLWIENLDIMPTHACVTICHAWWKSLSHYSINWHILKNILVIQRNQNQREKRKVYVDDRFIFF